MIHFIYKTQSTSGKYYIGRHSTECLDDGYVGSGKWIRSIKDKTQLTREILEFCNEDNILEREKYYLEQNVGKDNCMNFNLSPVGFSCGRLNPASSQDERIKRSIRFLGDKNPAKNITVRKRISESLKKHFSENPREKWFMSEHGKKNISKARTGLKYSEEGKIKLSQSRKKQFLNGRNPPTFANKKHTEEYKRKMREYYHSRPKICCMYCKNEYHPTVFGISHGIKCKLNRGCVESL